MHRFAAFILVFLLLSSECNARLRGITTAGSGVSPTAKTLIGGFDLNGTSLAFINLLKLGNSQSAGSFAFPSVLDNDGYPNNGTVTTEITTTVPLPQVYGTNSYIFDWSGTGGIKLTSSLGIISTSSNTCSGGTTGNNTSTMTVKGTNCSFTFNFPSGTSFSVNVAFPTSTTYTNMANARLYRTDQASELASGEIFNPDFIILLRSLNLKTIRPMDWTDVNGGQIAQSTYVAPTTAFSYRVNPWKRGGTGGDAWVAAGIDNPVSANVFTAAAPPNWAGIVAGATIQGKIIGTNTRTTLSVTSATNSAGVTRLNMADTSTLSTGQKIAFSSSGGVGNMGGIWTIDVISATQIELRGSVYQSNVTGTISTATLDVGGSGPKLIAGSQAPFSLVANDIGQFLYDEINDVWIYSAVFVAGSFSSTSIRSMPIEILVALANKINVNLWINVQFWFTDASITAYANYVKSNLNPQLNAYWEYVNEIWNPGGAFAQNRFATVRGRTLGFPAVNGEQFFGYWGLRAVQMFGILDTVYGVQTNYKKVLAFQAFGSTVVQQAYLLNGTDLVKCTSSCTTFQTNYNNFTGSTSYNAAPNRPVDKADSLSYATYFAGGVVNNGIYAASGTYSGMTAAADDYASGVPAQMASALSWFQSDVRTGTSTLSGGTGNTLQTLQVLSSTASIGKGAIGIYPSWEIVAASYDAARAGFAPAKAPLKVEAYEGGYEGFGPYIQVSAAVNQCADMGIADSYCNTLNASGQVSVNGSVQNLLDAYKNSTLFYDDVLLQYSGFLSNSHSSTPGWFALQGTSQPAGKWSQLPGNTYRGPTSLGPFFTGTPFKSYDATIQCNSASC